MQTYVLQKEVKEKGSNISYYEDIAISTDAEKLLVYAEEHPLQQEENAKFKYHVVPREMQDEQLHKKFYKKIITSMMIAVLVGMIILIGCLVNTTKELKKEIARLNNDIVNIEEMASVAYEISQYYKPADDLSCEFSEESTYTVLDITSTLYDINIEVLVDDYKYPVKIQFHKDHLDDNSQKALMILEKNHMYKFKKQGDSKVIINEIKQK